MQEGTWRGAEVQMKGRRYREVKGDVMKCWEVLGSVVR